MKNLLSAMVVLAGAQLATAAPIISSTVSDIGGGLYETVIAVEDGSSIGSWAANLTVTGADGATLNQVKAFGALSANDQNTGIGYAAIAGSGYSLQLDTWYYNPFTTVLATGVQELANGFRAHIGTAAGVNWGLVNVLHIVSTEGTLNYSGFIGRGGESYSVSGSIEVPTEVIPEPASLALIALGGLGLLRRRAAR